MSKLRKYLPLAFLLVFCLPLLAFLSCSASTTTASCAFIVGDGSSGRDKKLHRIIYPGQNSNRSDGETISYVPCNSRNYIINNGQVKNANGETVGDRGTLIQATTKNGVVINISARALWTLNQSKPAMEKFYAVCFKYQCASAQDVGGDVNFSTKGWNGMLAENFGPAMDASAREAAIKVDDSIWQKHDPEQYKALSNGMSTAFANAVRANLGYPEDLFCGSGNSAWDDPNNPGKGNFVCSPIRIVVDEVERGQIQANDSTEGAKALNAQRLENARALYGPDAGFWLGIQDTIDKCKAAATPCIFNIGGSGGAAVPVLGNNTVPTPTPTSVKR